MSFRKERKFNLTSYDAKLLKSELLNLGMVELYPKRKINSTYFDTKSYKAFYDSEEGLLPRKKTRIRWYENSTNYNLEEKFSSIEGRFKTSSEMNQDQYLEYLNKGYLDSFYGLIFSTKTISYYREYYSFNDIRITFDSEIKYYDFLTSETVNDFSEVMEIKCKYEVYDDYLEKIIPVVTSRFSKYARSFLAHSKNI
tara:strand:+ start:2875 stop:3465 length:591 start_codon:yes stop_codon:yes gene_type:complete